MRRYLLALRWDAEGNLRARGGESFCVLQSWLENVCVGLARAFPTDPIRSCASTVREPQRLISSLTLLATASAHEVTKTRRILKLLTMSMYFNVCAQAQRTAIYNVFRVPLNLIVLFVLLTNISNRAAMMVNLTPHFKTSKR